MLVVLCHVDNGSVDEGTRHVDTDPTWPPILDELDGGCRAVSVVIEWVLRSFRRLVDSLRGRGADCECCANKVYRRF